MTDEQALLVANAAYYDAFRTAKYAEMTRIWAEDGVSCVHPGWPVLVGRGAVLESYRKIMRNPAPEWIEPRDEIVLVSGSDGRVLCIEIVGGALALATTNWFRRVGGTWRMVHHQASPIAATVAEASSSARKKLN